LLADLVLIRTEYARIIPQVTEIKFQPVLISNHLGITLNNDDYARFERGEYHDLDSLNAHFGMTRILVGIYNSFHLFFRGRYQMWRLADIYGRVPSVMIAWPGDEHVFLCDPSTVIAWRLD
jgi:hypothetical protein